jgi:TonB family protein
MITKTAALFFILFPLFLGTAQRAEAQSSRQDQSVFAPEGEEFSVTTPVSLSLSESDASTQNRQYFGRFRNVRIYIFSDRISEKEGSYGRALSLAVAQKAKGVSTLLNGLKAQKFTFENEDGYSCELVALRTRKRKYIFQTLSDRRSDPDSRRFFSNITINTWRLNPPIPEKVATGVPVNTSPLPDSRIFTSDGSGVGSGRGTGNGSGSGVETDTGCGAARPKTSGNSPDPAEKISLLKILSKPPASYTDAARLHEIQGTVNLRVIFLANGTIGGVSPVSGLPFGLTEMAIAAARQIRFEPAKKNGVPCTVAKTVTFNFTY